jgi:leader peptidase (prepilin peptidase)/N-methyltransferase
MKPIKWFDNVPLISFIVLRRRCRSCGTPIPVRYFLVELVTALIGVALLYYFALTPKFFVYWFFSCALITIVAIDIEHQEIPDVISIPGIIIGLLLMTLLRLDGAGSYLKSFFNSLFGILAGGGSMFLLGVVGELIFRKEALGGGDVKLMGMIGAFLGWKLVLLTFFMAPVLGAGVGLFMKIRFRREVIAYGPYLSLGALISLLYGDRILNYLFFSL